MLVCVEWGLYTSFYTWWRLVLGVLNMETSKNHLYMASCNPLFYPTSGAHRLCVLEDSHDHKNSTDRPSKKVTTGATKDESPGIGDDQNLEKGPPQDPNSSKASEAKEQRLKELEDQLQAKQKELEECRARIRQKTLKQTIEEAEVTLQHLNKQNQSESHELINVDDPNPAAKELPK